MIQNRLPCYKAKKWANLWGKVGLLGLSPRVPTDLEDYRTVIEGLPNETHTFTIFPRDAVENRGSVSVLLRDSFDEYKPECIPAALFVGNRGLKGSLRATHVKTYSKTDKTRAGSSKEGWRLVLLQGCPQFMKSLEAFDEDERFSLGSGYVYIRGGTRKPRSGANRTLQGQPRSSTSSGPRSSSSDHQGNTNNEEPPRSTERRDRRRRSGNEGGRSSNDGTPSWVNRPRGPRGPGSTPWTAE